MWYLRLVGDIVVKFEYNLLTRFKSCPSYFTSVSTSERSRVLFPKK